MAKPPACQFDHCEQPGDAAPSNALSANAKRPNSTGSTSATKYQRIPKRIRTIRSGSSLVPLHPHRRQP